ncbi:rhodanese-related sulfurtransferase [Candidatus Woesearchaeota archaeon]|nr:rhodanese-related sulfurtransferase [Candidatus Woesearchaeota archaeon]
MYNTISFYRYTTLVDPQELHNQLRSFCNQHNILGRVLIGDEGINGAVSGRIQDINLIKLFLQEKFSNLTFREQSADKNTYHKLVIKVRKEICVFGEHPNLENTGHHLTPQELQQLYEKNEDFIIVDARNDYEYDVGHFKNAMKLPIQTFSEFPQEILKHEDWKEKKVVLYCTGGVRCEKASAFMKENGFKDVNQLDGGIINYVNQFSHDKWKGGLFVFDDRLISDVGLPISKCLHCNKDELQMYNCHNLDCDKLHVSCKDCAEQFNNTCSKECMQAPRQRKQKITLQEIGTVLNYYNKNHIALITFDQKPQEGMTIQIQGKTTSFTQEINTFMIDEQGLFTIPVKDRVRKNDLILVPQ